LHDFRLDDKLSTPLMNIPTRKQLNRLAAHNLLEDRDYTKEEASGLIAAVIESGAKPNWKLAEINYWDLMNRISLRQAKSRLAELESIFDEDDTSDANMAIDYEIGQCEEIIEEVKSEKEDRKEFLRDRIREYQDELNPTGWELSETGISPWKDQIKKPKIAQVKECVEILDVNYPGWEEIWGTQTLVNTLLKNFPELQCGSQSVRGQLDVLPATATNDLQRIEVFCPSCGNRLEAPAIYRGHDLKCRICEELIKVPVEAAMIGQAPTKTKNFLAEKLSKKEVLAYLALTIAGLIWAAKEAGVRFSSSSTSSFEDTANSSNRVKQDSSLVETASSEQLQRVESALRNKYSVSNALTVRSQTHHLAYYVGASFSINVVGGVDQVVGIWIMDGGKNNPNSTFSVNEIAYQFSGMGRAKDTKIRASVVDDEAQALTRALQK
jgi:hypothetical protein